MQQSIEFNAAKAGIECTFNRALAPGAVDLTNLSVNRGREAAI